MCYCVCIKVTLGEGGGDQPPPFHAWSGSLIADMFQESLEEWITEAVILAQGRQSYSLDDYHSKKGPPWEHQGCQVQLDRAGQLDQ